ncbi:hypothetical protein ABIB35_003118 [Arthrobacter sp. UYP6]
MWVSAGEMFPTGIHSVGGIGAMGSQLLNCALTLAFPWVDS